jgi:6-phosphogluconolactonase
MALLPNTILPFIGALIAAAHANGGTAPVSDTAAHRPDAAHIRVYIGSYTQKEKTGITLLEMNTKTGELERKAAVYDGPNPTYLVISPDHRFLYACNEVGDYNGDKAGAAAAFSIDPATGSLTLLGQQSTKGDGPCHIEVDKQNKIVLAANYGGGSLAAFPVHSDGTLGPASAFIQHEGKSVDPARQEGPHAHCFTLDASNRYAFACDLGLDKVYVYKVDKTTATLEPNDPPFATVPPGSGPRHIAFTPNNHFAYVCNEMLSTVTAFAYDPASGKLTSLQTLSTVPKDFHGDNSTAEIETSHDGRFVYVSNRGHNSIAIFSIDGKSGHLTPVGHQSTEGKTPRCFKIDPTGNWMIAANQDTDNVISLRVDRKTGKLTPTGHSVRVSMPVCVQYLPVSE